MGRADPLWPEAGEEIDVELFDVDREMAGGLGGVDEKWDAAFVRELSDFFDGLDRAGDVGGVGDGDEAGVVAKLVRAASGSITPEASTGR